MRCPTCGFENLDHARRCIGCNQILIAEQQMQPPPPLQQEDLRELGQYKPAILLRLSIGEMVGGSFSVYFRYFASFFSITLLANIPAFFYIFLLSDPQWMKSDPSFAIAFGLGGMLLGLLPTQLATGAMTFGVLQHLRQRTFTFGEALQVGLTVMITVIAVALVQFVVVVVGMMACVIPGVIAAVACAVAVPAAVEERSGAIGALRRSFDLTKDYRTNIFGILAVLTLIHLVISFGIGAVFFWSPESAQIVSGIEGIIFSGLTATAAALIYYRLRCIKESVGIDDLASVFD